MKGSVPDMRVGLTFGDVLLVPKFSDVRSRKDADSSSRITSAGHKESIPRDIQKVV